MRAPEDALARQNAFLRSLALSLLGDEHLADDVVQSAWVAAIEKRRDAVRSWRAWATGVVRNLASKARRSAGRRAVREREAKVPAGEPPPDQVLAHEEVLRHVTDAVLELEEPYRSTVVMRFFEGLMPVEIARRTSAPVATVRSRIQRALTHLRRRLDQYGGDDRRAWAAPLAGLLGPEGVDVVLSTGSVGSGTIALTGGIVAMSMKPKLVITALIALTLMGGGAFYLLMGKPGVQESAPASFAGTSGEAPSPVVSATDRTEALERNPVTDLAVDPPSTVVIASVRWEEDGSPARDIAVRWYPSASNASLFERAARTDEVGMARFDGVLPGSSRVVVDRGQRVTTEVTEGATVTVEVEIPSGIEVRGTVVDVADQPVPAADIWLSRNSSSVDDGDIVTSSGPDGQFVIRDVQPGRMVSAMAEGFAPALVYKIPDDAVKSPEVTLKLIEGPRVVEGRVLDPKGEPVENAAVLVGFAHGGSLRVSNDGVRMAPTLFSRTDRDGWFRVSGPYPGSLPVWARAPGFAVWCNEISVPETGVSTVEIRLVRGATIAGRILDPGGEPAEDVRIDLLHDDIEPSAGMGWAGPSWARPWARTDRDGSFQLEQVKPGKMRVRAQKDRMSVVAELSLLDGQREIWEGVLGSGETIAGILTDVDGAPLSGWRVHGKPSEGQQKLALLRNTVTDEQGLFVLKGAEPGSYDIAFVLEDDGLHPAVVEVFEVAPGPEPLLVTVPETRVPSARFSGRILSRDGTPLEGFDVHMRRQGEDGTVETASGVQQIQDGSFVTKLVPPGRYSLDIYSNEAEMLNLGERVVGSSETVDIGTHRFGIPGSLQIELVGPDGITVPAARLLFRKDTQPQGMLMSLDHGVGRLDNLQPGHYMLSSWGADVTKITRSVEVVGGQETKIRFKIPHGVPVKLRYPPIPRHNYMPRAVWRDPAGTMVLEHGGMLRRTREPRVSTVVVPPGTYTLEFSDTSGAVETIEVIASDPPDGRVYDLPVLWR